MVQAIDIRQPDADKTRTELSLGQIAEQWRYQPRGEEFAEALLSFLRRIDSPDTLKSYAFATLQFFNWLWRTRGRLPTPDRVSRGDAAEFARWLRTRSTRMTEWWLEKDPTRRLDLRIFEIVQRDPGIDYEGIASRLGAYTPNSRTTLAERLACLTKRRTLERSPTVEEYRRQNGGAIIQPPDEIFRYRPPQVETEKGAERASMVLARVSVLSSLWNWMIESGENTPGSETPLLKYNIWRAPMRANRHQAASFQAASRARKKPDIELFKRLLASTFDRTHGRMAMRAAEAMLYGQPVPPARTDVSPTFKDLRDRAVLLVMIHTGVRAREIGSLKRESVDVSTDPPTLTIAGKGGKRRVIGIPPGTMLALREMSSKLRAMADHQDRWNYSGRARTLLEPSAPLLPALSYWGANRGTPDKGLSRPGLALLLNRRAEAAGIPKGSPEFARIHPHGLRALFITHALDTGTPIHRVQAIAGHAQIGTTGRYAEERRPDRLIVDVFRGQPLQGPSEPPSVSQLTPEAQKLSAESWQRQREAIAPPSPPRPEPPEQIRPPIEQLAGGDPELEEFLKEQQRFEAKPVLRVEEEEMPAVQPPSAAQMRAQVDKLADKIARWRREPLTARENSLLDKCAAVPDQAIRNLCIIYSVHWGEKGNRQVLVSTGGGEASAEKRAQGGGLSFTPNEDIEEFDEEYDEEDDDFGEEDFEEYFSDEPDEEELAAFGQRSQGQFVQVMREAGAELFAEAAADRLNRIYSGKESGLSWWTGTQGKLEPAMPVMSPEQVGVCTPLERSNVCAGLVKLWQEWFADSPTKAEALVQWIGEALDTAAQMEGEVSRRAGRWVGPAAPWPETRFVGPRRQPEPREVFRQHVDKEVVAWFRARAGSYRTSTGDPEGWSQGEKPKAIGDPAPTWYEDDDPVRALPLEERRALIDWILALTGQLPVDTDRRFRSPQGFFASRADIARFVNAVCQLDATIEGLRVAERYGPQFTSAQIKKNETVDTWPSELRRALGTINEEARSAMSDASGARFVGFDAYGRVRDRIRGKNTGLRKRRTLAGFYVDLVEEFFGPEAARDPAINLVAKCGKVPLAKFKDLFRVRGETITHDESFKRRFAQAYGTHSECVARRIARKLWEIKQGRDTPKEAVTKPKHMVTLVEVMQLFKVPCSQMQATELRRLREWTDDPNAIYSSFAKVKMRSGGAREALSEAEEDQAALADQFQDQIAQAYVSDVFGEYNENPARPPLPTPVQLAFALV